MEKIEGINEQSDEDYTTETESNHSMVKIIEEDLEDEILQLCEDYLQEYAIHMSSPDFYDQMVEYIMTILFLETDSLVKKCVDYSYSIFQIPIRHYDEDYIPILNIIQIQKTLDSLSKIPQPKQRTPEWYAYRHERFSASNVYKLFGSSAEYNSLIYEKCKHYEVFGGDGGASNSNNPRNWGVKYEPVSVQIYEHMFNTRVKSDYGCIPHPVYKFIAASPDGIVVDPESPRYGHMLEIKNIYNRKIDGIPFEKYWIQMQIQMETCNLDYCDFLETRFKEYDSEKEFYESTDREYKGVFLYFLPKPDHCGLAFFKYMPLYISLDQWSIKKWIYEQQQENSNYFLYNTIYWYLDEISCVVVERNLHWIESAIPIMKMAWDIVEKERNDGYNHRAPTKRTKKPIIMSDDNNTTDESKRCNMMSMQNSVCLIKLDENGDII